MLIGSRGIPLVLLIAALAGSLFQVVPAESAPGQDRTAIAKTTIKLTVRKCGERCRIQAVQNKRGTLTYSAPQRIVRGGHVTFEVPTARTSHMAFLVYPHWDKYAASGLPMVVALGFRDRPVGARITRHYARPARRASGCWRGTTLDQVHRTLVITRKKIDGSLIGIDGKVPVAGGFFTRTLAARPYWYRVTKASMHASDPSICS